MLMKEIRRDKAGIEIDTSTALSCLAESARTLLGYSVLADTVEQVGKKPGENQLLAILEELDIEILNEQDVVRYQKEMLITRTTVLMQKWMEETAKASLDDVRVAGHVSFGGPSWQLVKIDEYRLPIPEFVLQKAVQIKERMPECVLYVEWLSDHPDPFLLVAPSPGRYSWQKPEEHYYIEVWDEPKFEGMLRQQQDRTPFDEGIPF